MRHRYDTRGLIVARANAGEANASLTILTSELGLVRAAATGVRRSGAKLASALTTFSESALILVRGKETWRVAGASLERDRFGELGTAAARARAARLTGLLVRLAAHEAHDPALFEIMTGFFDALAAEPPGLHDGAEVLAALRLLAALGFDEGALPGAPGEYARAALEEVARARGAYVARVNRGIAASGL